MANFAAPVSADLDGLGGLALILVDVRVIISAPHCVVLLVRHNVDSYHSIMEFSRLIVGLHDGAVKQDELQEDDRQANEQRLSEFELPHVVEIADVQENHEVEVQA